MIYGAHFLLYSKDAEADRAFLRDILRFQAVDIGHGWLLFNMPPAELGVHPGSGEFVQERLGHRMIGATLYLMCDDLRARIRLLKSHGIQSAKIVKADWGSSTMVVLPSGAAIGLFQPTHALAFGRANHAPDLSRRRHSCRAERRMKASPDALFLAWTQQFDRWFAAPGSVVMTGAEGSVFFFETEFQGTRHPHYGRFLRVRENRLVQLTWLSSGTQGAETVVTVKLTPDKKGTRLQLIHAGFPDAESKSRHQEAWPMVLEQLDQRIR